MNSKFSALLLSIITISHLFCAELPKAIDTSRFGKLEFVMRSGESTSDTSLTSSVYYLHVEGPHFSRSDRLEENAVQWADVPENHYKFRLTDELGALYAGGKFRVKRGGATKVTADFYEVTPSANPPFLYYYSVSGDISSGITRNVYGDWQQNLLSNGTREIFHAGQTCGLDVDGLEYLRFDSDNDRIPDEEDEDDDNDGIYDSVDPDDDNDQIPDSIDTEDTDNNNDGILNALDSKALILGQYQYPVIRGFQTSNLSSGGGRLKHPGDLLLLEAEISPCSGLSVNDVKAELWKDGRMVLEFPLFDDGSVSDLNAAWPGRQISGDFEESDSRYSRLIPVDAELFHQLNRGLLLVRAKNILGKMSNTWEYYFGVLEQTVVPDKQSHLLENIKKISVAFDMDSKSGKIGTLKAEALLKEEMDVKILHGKGEVQTLWMQDKPDGKYYEAQLNEPKNMYFLLWIVDQFAGIYYTGVRY
jgi:hypothetical protein